MKKKICVLGMVFALASAVFAGCGEKDRSETDSQEQSSEQEVTSEQDYNEFMQELERINSVDSMINKYGYAGYTCKETLADGSDFLYTIYKDENREVYTDKYGVLIKENQDIYGNDEENDLYIRYLFIGDTYEEFRSFYFDVSIHEYSEKEEVTLKEVKDGMIYLETEIKDGIDKELLATYGFESENIEYILTEYVIDESTLEIYEVKSYVVMGNQKNIFLSVKWEKECEEYILDEEIIEGVYGDDSRTLSVVVDEGTADEKVYTQTVTKGSAIIVMIPEEFEQKVYADPECTEEAIVDKMNDQTLYLKRIEE